MSPHPSAVNRTIVIVGASDRPDRTSHQLLSRIKARSDLHPILVHPRLKEIDGIPVHSSLADVPLHPEIVTLYVNAEASQKLVDDLQRLKPGKVIFNPGAENRELMNLLNQAGIDTEDACSLVLLSQNAL